MDNKVEWTPTAKQYFMHLCSRLERALSLFEEAVKRGDPALEENFFFIEGRVFDAFSALRSGQVMCLDECHEKYEDERERWERGARVL